MTGKLKDFLWFLEISEIWFLVLGNSVGFLEAGFLDRRIRILGWIWGIWNGRFEMGIQFWKNFEQYHSNLFANLFFIFIFVSIIGTLKIYDNLKNWKFMEFWILKIVKFWKCVLFFEIVRFGKFLEFSEFEIFWIIEFDNFWNFSNWKFRN